MMLRAINMDWTTMIQMEIYREIAPEVVEYTVTNAKKSALASGKGLTVDIEQAMEFIGNWLTSIRENDPIFYRSVKSLFPENSAA